MTLGTSLLTMRDGTELDGVCLVFKSARAATTKYHRCGGLNNRNFISLSSEGWKAKIKMPAWLGSGEGCLSSLQMAAFSLCAHMAFHWCACLETGRVFWLLLTRPLP